MKRFLLFLFSTFLILNVNAQKRGYYEIKIGNSIDSVIALHKYKITKDTRQKNNWTITGDGLTIFSMDIQNMIITIDSAGKIRQVEITTQEKIFEDYKDWLSKLKNELLLINSNVEQRNSENTARESEAYFNYAWSFYNINTALVFRVPRVLKFTTHFKSNYSFYWFEDEKHMAEIKW